jgi:Bacterial Ig-like domain (group 2)
VSDGTDREVLEYLDKILEIVLKTQRLGEKMAADIDVLVADVAEQSTIEDGILTMVEALVANQNNPAKLQAIVAGMAANKAKLVQAIQVGTPQASTALTITPSPVSMAAVGAVQQLKVVDPSGADVTATATYSSSDATKATVSAAGLVTDVAAGTATISVASGVSAGTVAVTTA